MAKSSYNSRFKSKFKVYNFELQTVTIRKVLAFIPKSNPSVPRLSLSSVGRALDCLIREL